MLIIRQRIIQIHSANAILQPIIKIINIVKHHKLIYCIINCGFREGEQNITALNIVKNWCDKVLIEYSGSILIGAGEVIKDIIK